MGNSARCELVHDVSCRTGEWTAAGDGKATRRGGNTDPSLSCFLGSQEAKEIA